MQFVYVAGAITPKKWPRGLKWLGELVNRYKSVKYTRQLLEQGFCVHTPHLQTLLVDHSMSYESILDHDLEVMKRCDIIAFMPNWVESTGAKREYAFAVQWSKEIIFLE